jgi:hypothetical protein
VKEFLSERGIPYQLKNVSRDAAALAEFQRLGYLLPPVTVVDGVAVRGYDPERLAALLDGPEG